MSELTVGSRYAKSLIDLAQEQNIVDVIKADMDLFLHTLKASSELKAVLSNPIISHAKKIKILDEVFLNKVNKATIAFFKLMVTKGRGEVLFTTAYEYINLYNIKKHITKAKVASATKLSAANEQVIIAEVQKAVGGTVILETKVDPSLIGGFVLTVGDRQVDTSIAASLKKLKKEFAEQAV
ncbi:ATP synthase F1 subunit delta [Mucilaginibacter sp. SP1R1]|uniref:ATP synthase F1 subunit delta n=1 Tax=Mucilaginibacter sp. SP1R1 TaxID=2723091 RepID=UPI001610217C|nr:ATP synthase F1 subunit delta [Mucilaginibacter sp. SP1R1]MBB6150787.1 F-type H+-transporting ATPase subunit delta [Mucilaginibacter sp. SP1R1]